MATHKSEKVSSYYDYNFHLVDPKEKTEEWALEFIRNRYPQLRFYGYTDTASGRPDLALLRTYGEGRQPESIYKIQFDPQGAYNTTAGEKASTVAQYVGINWNIVSVIPKYKRIISAKIEKLEALIEARAIDPLAKNQRENDKMLLSIQKEVDEILEEISRKMNIKGKPLKSEIDKELLNTTQSQSISQFGDIEFNLDNDAELEMFMDTYYKQKVEIAQEVCINALLQLNEIEEIKKLWINDALDFGVAAGRVYMDSNTQLPKMDYLEPNKIKISYSRRKDYKDADIWMYDDMWTISQVIQHFGEELSMDEVREIFKYGVKTYGYWNGRTLDYNIDTINLQKLNRIDFERVRVGVSYFEFKSQNCETYEYKKAKYGSIKLKKRPANYKTSKEDSRVQNHWAQVVYKGYYIVGMSRIFQYGMLPNMIREAGKEQITQYSLQLYEFAKKSFVEQIIPHADQIQIAYLKLQQCVLKSKPSGWSFNIDALSNIILGDGGYSDVRELIRMFDQTGSMVHKTIDENGNPILANANAPHMKLDNGLGGEVRGYLEVIGQHIQMIEATIGYNPMMSGQLPDPRVSAYSQKVASAQADNATYYLTNGISIILSNTAYYMSSLVQDMCKYKNDGYEALKSMVGSVNLSIVDSMDKLHTHQFGITLKQQMTEEERAQFKQFVMAAYERGEIDLSDVIMVWFMNNYKQAIALFNLKRQKQIAMNMQMQQQQMQAQMAQSQQMMQLKAQLASMESQTQLQKADMQIKGEMALEQLKEQTKGNLKMLTAEQREQLEDLKTNNDIKKKRAEQLSSLLGM